MFERWNAALLGTVLGFALFAALSAVVTLGAVERVLGIAMVAIMLLATWVVLRRRPGRRSE